MNLPFLLAIVAVIAQAHAYDKRKTTLPPTTLPPTTVPTTLSPTPADLETSKATKHKYPVRKTRPTILPTDAPTIAALQTTMASVLPSEQTSTIGERLTTKEEVPPVPTTAAPLIESTSAPLVVETTIKRDAETTMVQTTMGSAITEGSPMTKAPPKVTPGPTLPPVDFDCRNKDDGYYADPKNKCSSKWYACVGGLARRLECSSSDLVWEPDTNACERRQDSFRCTGIRKTTLPTTPRRPPPPPVKLPIDCSKSDDGWFPDPLKKCSHIFYSCSNGIGARFECPGNMYFDKDASMCEAFHDVEACAGKKVKTTRKPITTVKPPVTEKLPIDCSNKDSGSYPDPSKKCSQIYYVCSNGDGYKRSCPDGLFYDHKTKLCDYNDAIFACSGKTRPPTKPTPAPKPSPASIPSSEFDCKGKDGKRFTPLDKKCSNVYYRCVGDITYKLNCPEGLYYDIENDLCDRWWGLFVCSGKKPTSPAPVTTIKPKPTEKLPIDCNTYDDGDFPDPEKKCSNVYYSCSNHGGLRRLCPPGLYFDSEMYICDQFNNLPDCTGKPRPATTLAPSKAPPAPPMNYPYSCEKKSDGNYEAGKCIDYYWSCVGGTTIRASCPHGTFYDIEFDHCGYKNEIPACGGVRPTTQKPKP
jgi:hypothetical protein